MSATYDKAEVVQVLPNLPKVPVVLESEDKPGFLFQNRQHFHINLTSALSFAFTFIIGILLGYLYQQNNHLRNAAAQQQSKIIQVQQPVYNISTNSTVAISINEYRRDFIRNMTREAFDLYRKHAWGNMTISPVTRKPHNSGNQFGEGQTIVEAMTTLWVMDLKKEFELARSWVNESLVNLEQVKVNIYLNSAIPGYIGSLLSCYALTNDTMFLVKAHQMAQVLKPAFNSSKGYPYPYVNPVFKGFTEDILFLSEVNVQELEFQYLSHLISNDTELVGYLEKIWDMLERGVKKNSQNGLIMNVLDRISGIAKVSFVNLFRHSSPFYQNLIKSYLQRQDPRPLKLYQGSMNSMDRVGVFSKTKTGLVYSRNYDTKSGQFGDQIDRSGCAVGAMLSLGAHAMRTQLKVAEGSNVVDSRHRRKQEQLIHKHENLAEEITELCHMISNHTRTGLPAKWFYFDAEGKLDVTTDSAGTFDLGPQLAESYFILYRLTHDSKYRDYAWELVQAIYRNCRTEGGGYITILSNDKDPTDKYSDIQPIHFLSATLKYLYLIFTDDSVLPLDQWVFNSHGHPLPIM